MITANFFKNSQGQYVGFSLSGHAGYADRGEDIVCAAASVLAINTANSIDTFTDDKFTADTDEQSGTLSLSFDMIPSEQSILLIDSLLLGLTGIKDEYGSKYLQILIKEV